MTGTTGRESDAHPNSIRGARCFYGNKVVNLQRTSGNPSRFVCAFAANLLFA